jgi:hypothetical protein
VNLRTQFQRYVLKAGVKPWPKLWQNLRASRATELADSYPSHVCAAWLGHTEAVADAFYRTVTDAHFDRAVASQKAAHNPTQQAHADACTTTQGNSPAIGKPLIYKGLQQGAPGCDDPTKDLLGDRGFEPLTSCVSCSAGRPGTLSRFSKRRP